MFLFYFNFYIARVSDAEILKKKIKNKKKREKKKLRRALLSVHQEKHENENIQTNNPQVDVEYVACLLLLHFFPIGFIIFLKFYLLFCDYL